MEVNYRKKIIQSRTGVFFKYVFLILMTIISLAPVVWVIISGFKSNGEIYANSFGLPRQWLLDNYRSVLSSTGLLRGYYNSFVTGFWVLSITLVLGSMVAYVSSRLSRTGALSGYFAFGIMIPMQSILIPTFHIMKNLGILYTRQGIILSYVASSLPITVFLLHGFMKGIPKELEEAAIMDGCSRLRVFTSVILPMSKPGIATVLTMNVLSVWNDYLFSMVLGGQKFYNITVMINNLRSNTENATDYGMICAGLAFAIIPLAVIYLLLQENVIKGMAEGAIKA